jgi:hypothetical protein
MHKNHANYYRLYAAFEFLTVDLHCCTGSPEIGGPHRELTSPLRRFVFHQLHHLECVMYDRRIGRWFEDFISLRQVAKQRASCWQVQDRDQVATSVCTGKRTDYPKLVVSLPAILILDIPIDKPSKTELATRQTGQPSQSWKFPLLLRPSETFTHSEAEQVGVIYDLAGISFFSVAKSHYLSQYFDHDHLSNIIQVYAYDNRKDKGYIVQELELEDDLNVAGTRRGYDLNVPKGYTTVAVVYHLRGESRAQDSFFNARKQMWAELFNLDFSSGLSELPKVFYHRPDFVEIPSANPGMKEYVFQHSLDAGSPESEEPTIPSRAFPKREHSSQPGSPESTMPSRPKPQSGSSPIHSDSASSRPDSPFQLKCRCGLEGNGNDFYNKEAGVAIKCDDCQRWSHVACQKNGRALNWARRIPFHVIFAA